MTDLAEWLLACIAEDEEVARACPPLTDWWASGGEGSVASGMAQLFVEHFDPATVLADLAVKRRIVELHRHEAKGPGPVLYDGSRDLNEGVFGCVICSCVDDDPGWHFAVGWCQTVRLLALPYAGREGYDPAWAPSDF